MSSLQTSRIPSRGEEAFGTAGANTGTGATPLTRNLQLHNSAADPKRLPRRHRAPKTLPISKVFSCTALFAMFSFQHGRAACLCWPSLPSSPPHLQAIQAGEIQYYLKYLTEGLKDSLGKRQELPHGCSSCSGWQGTACPGLLRAPHNPCWFSSPVLLTGSRPSMASIHSLRSSSDSACMVITPGLQGEAQVAKMNFSSEEEGRRTSSLPAPGGQTPRASLQGAGSAGEQSTATTHSSGVLCMSWGPNSSSGPQAGSSPELGQADHGTAGEGREVTGKGDQGRGQGKGDTER